MSEVSESTGQSNETPSPGEPLAARLAKMGSSGYVRVLPPADNTPPSTEE